MADDLLTRADLAAIVAAFDAFPYARLDESILAADYYHGEALTAVLEPFRTMPDCERMARSALAAMAASDEARCDLARIVALCGWDCDGNDPESPTGAYHLYRDAVQAVRELRQEHEEDVAEVEKERDEVRAEAIRLRAELDEIAAILAPGALTTAEGVEVPTSPKERAQIVVHALSAETGARREAEQVRDSALIESAALRVCLRLAGEELGHCPGCEVPYLPQALNGVDVKHLDDCLLMVSTVKETPYAAS